MPTCDEPSCRWRGVFVAGCGGEVVAVCWGVVGGGYVCDVVGMVLSVCRVCLSLRSVCTCSRCVAPAARLSHACVVPVPLSLLLVLAGLCRCLFLFLFLCVLVLSWLAAWVSLLRWSGGMMVYGAGRKWLVLVVCCGASVGFVTPC